MGQLGETEFDAVIRAGCRACGSTALDIRSFIDRRLDIMMGEPNDDGRWIHDGEKFVDGTFHIACASCGHDVFADTACPRCHAPGGLARALGETNRLAVPRRCPACNETEFIAVALIPATVRYTDGAATAPRPLGDLGDPGYHVVAYACESCDAAVVAKGCPLCDAPGPLRQRP
jgi:hypothetical protein